MLLFQIEAESSVRQKLSTISNEHGEIFEDSNLLAHLMEESVDFSCTPVVTSCTSTNDVATKVSMDNVDADTEWDGPQDMKVVIANNFYIFRRFNSVFDRRHMVVLTYIIRYVITLPDNISKSHLLQCLSNCEREQIPFISLYQRNIEKTASIVKSMQRKYHKECLCGTDTNYVAFKKDGKKVIIIPLSLHNK